MSHISCVTFGKCFGDPPPIQSSPTRQQTPRLSICFYLKIKERRQIMLFGVNLLPLGLVLSILSVTVLA